MLATCFSIILFGFALLSPVAGANECLNQYFARNDYFLRNNAFPKDRTIRSFIKAFGDGFESRLRELPEEAHWLDSGAGLAYPQAGAVDGGQRIGMKIKNLTALGVARPRGSIVRIPERNFKYLEGRYLEDIPVQEIGAADLITDYYGPFSYSGVMDQILNKYLQILKKDGSLYIFFDTKKTTVNGVADGLGQYLKSIQGASVEWLPSIYQERYRAIRIQKVSDQFHVPPLKLENFVAGHVLESVADPWRWYSTGK